MACLDAVSRCETERRSGLGKIVLVGARAACGSDSHSAVSRVNEYCCRLSMEKERDSYWWLWPWSSREE
ncbi:hypothetical protein ILYODFUR_023686 [Ilyodon furcidens]|uniref:Uncharacterized protein n=1 Tax=Ilyodon furcidens TaxID=33524 RepID=A0ABV0T0P1_9TELE